MAVVEDQAVELRSWNLYNESFECDVGMQKDKQVDVGKTSFLELNGVNMSYSSAKEAIINKLEKCFLLLLKDP